MINSSAPGKFVVMGEHAVVYGKPALALAIDMRFSLRMTLGKTFRVNGKPATNATMSPHMKWISQAHGNKPVSVFIDGRVPTGSGLGSSAALSAAYSGAVRQLCGASIDHESVAKEAYEAEYAAQGRGSPMDTSAAVNGGGVALNVPCRKEDLLWTIKKNNNSWDISRFDVPEMTFVIGNTGIKAATGPLVEKVRKYREESEFAYNIVEEIGQLTLDGMKCITRNDWVELGTLMSYNHKLLGILGVSCPELDSLVEAAMPTSYGAKLTGSGGGGCMVALTDKPEDTAEAIRSAGGVPYIVKTGVPGLEIREREKKPAKGEKGKYTKVKDSE